MKVNGSPTSVQPQPAPSEAPAAEGVAAAQPVDGKSAAAPVEQDETSPHANWRATKARGRSQLLDGAGGKRLASGARLKRGARAAKLAARHEGRTERPGWRLGQALLEIVTLGAYGSVWDSKRLQHKLGEDLAGQVGDQVAAVRGTYRLTQGEGFDSEGFTADLRAGISEALSQSAKGASVTLSEQALREATDRVLEGFLSVDDGEATDGFAQLAQTQGGRWTQLAEGLSGSSNSARRRVAMAALEGERSGQPPVPDAVLVPVLKSVGSRLPPENAAEFLLAFSQLDTAARTDLENMLSDAPNDEAKTALMFVMVSEGHALAGLEGTDREGALDRIDQAFEQLTAPEADAEALRQEGVLGLTGPTNVEVAGVGPIEFYVHPGVSQDQVEHWQALVAEGFASYPPNLRQQLIGASEGESGMRIALYPSDSINYLQHSADGVFGSYNGQTGTLALSVNGHPSRDDALHTVHHELAHRLSDVMVPDADGAIVSASDSPDGEATPLFERLEGLQSEFARHGGYSAEEHEHDSVANQAGGYSAYALTGDADLTLKRPEEFLAEAMSAYLDGGESAALFREVDPEFYRCVGYALAVAESGDLERAREILLNVEQPESDQQMLPRG